MLNLGNLSLDEAVSRSRAALQQGLSAAARAARAGRPDLRVVGCFPVYSPHEIFHASGAHPLGLIGGGTSGESTHADSRFQSFICSIAKSTLELGLQSRLEGVDGAVFHSICDVARNLASLMKRNFPDLWVEYLHFPQNMTSAGSLDYAVAEYRRLRDNLARWTGRAATDDLLRASIRLYNRARRLMRQLYELRRDHPGRLSAVELFLLVRGGTLMPPDEHAELLDAALRDARARDAKPRDRVRVLVEGAFCEQPPVDLVDTLERAGCYVVDDDFLRGWRWFDGDIDETGDPIKALARGYLERSVNSSVRCDVRRPKPEELVKRVRAAKADAVLFLPAKFCEPALLDYVLYRQALEKESIPHLVVEFEEKMWTFERTRNEVETFVESLLFE